MTELHLFPLGDLHEHDEDCMCADCQERDMRLADAAVDRRVVELAERVAARLEERDLGPMYADLWIRDRRYLDVRSPLLCTDESCA